MISSTIGVWPNLNEVTFKGFGAYGFSGGPVYNVSNENIVAVFARSNYENCFGPRITANMMQIIGNYRE